ncbi:MAG: aminotransferase class V-fold PLP-dependent enzyme [bacterium]|nr:aminotransferase class V-fold PLP-dependent enzyme [bacterium]
MSIFNSLGSNYNLKFVASALFAGNTPEFRDVLENFLNIKYGGKVILTYKGREAIELALRSANLPRNSKVAITGFTCWVVYNAVTRAGLKVAYLDIERQSLNFTAETFRKTLKASPDIKALIIQNTLGYPCQIDQISEICKESEVLLIEDLAHCVGTKYGNGLEAGTVGDFTALSFSQDKMIDAISGGALVIRNKKFQTFSPELNELKSRQQLIDRLYPLFTFKIRKSYNLGFGKLFHFFLRAVNLLSKPAENGLNQPHKLPNWYCRLVKIAFEDLERDLFHRRKIASIYADNLDSKITSGDIKKQIPLSSCLRFPVFVKNRSSLIGYLKKKGVYISDIWYDAPIAPQRYLSTTDYKDQCPNAEKVSQEIINLPTHKNTNAKDAECIAGKINQWLKSQ